ADARGTVPMKIGEYDPARPLVIDPVLSYSSYLGGGGFDHGNAIAVDALGNIYVAGGTGSANFTTANAAQSNFGGAFDCFVAKLNPRSRHRRGRCWAGLCDGDDGVKQFPHCQRCAIVFRRQRP
ncbi:MAG: SBBP repeat-containing protein, partial [Blastocatellia bacterium]